MARVNVSNGQRTAADGGGRRDPRARERNAHERSAVAARVIIIAFAWHQNPYVISNEVINYVTVITIFYYYIFYLFACLIRGYHMQ